MSNWLPIAEYSVKNGVSISTVRRRIKAKELRYKLRNGKYIILDEGTGQNIPKLKAGKPNTNNILSMIDNKLNRVLEMKSDLIEEKDRTIKAKDDLVIYLRKQIDELKMLVSVLEKKLN